MKCRNMILGAILVFALLASSAALAAAETGYDLSWWTTDGGGGTSSGVGYSLRGTIGQPDAGSLMTGSGYQLTGGFWGGVLNDSTLYYIYLPLTTR